MEEIARSGEEQFGISGYPKGKWPKFDAKTDRSTEFSVPKDNKPRAFIDNYIKVHSIDPGPKYKVELDMTQKSITLENLPNYTISKGKVESLV